MEELKPCLLPCNLEQLNDSINTLALEIARMGEQDTIRVRKAFLIAHGRIVWNPPRRSAPQRRPGKQAADAGTASANQDILSAL